MNEVNSLTKDWLKFNLKSAGELNLAPKENVYYGPLLISSKRSGLIPTNTAKFASEENIKNIFNNDDINHVIAYYLKGNFSSAFDRSIAFGTSYENKLLQI